MGRKRKALTYAAAFKIWKKVEHIDFRNQRVVVRVTRTWFTKESGDHDSPPDLSHDIVNKRKAILAMDPIGVMLSDNMYYPFFVLSRIKPRKCKTKVIPVPSNSGLGLTK